MSKPFYVKDCALAVISTGISAASIIDFKEAIAKIPPGSLYFHFWRRLFWSSFANPEYHNDFALWSYRYLHDTTLSERLGIIDPTEFSNLEDLRNEIIEVIEQRIDEIEYISYSTRENKFHFLRSEIIIFDTQTTIEHPSQLKTQLPLMTSTSIFYHFIDARRRTSQGKDDFSTWLEEEKVAGAEELLNKIGHIDPYFFSLIEQRQKLIEIMNEHFR